MVRPDLLLFGYVTVTVAEADKSAAADILLKNGVSATINAYGEFIIPYRKKENILRLFSGSLEYSLSQPQGLFPLFYKHRHRYGVFLGIILSVFLIFLSADTVWDIRIEGIDAARESAVLEELSDAGLSVGNRWSRINKSEVEIQALSKSENIAWININRRGGVAYVKVSDKILYQDGEEPSGTANIVAARDCVIEEIIVERGYAMVKKGESVKAGDLLISGVIPTELGGGFCYASGVVIGRYDEKIEVFTDKTVRNKAYTDRILVNMSVNIFGRETNIFKKYRQYGESCDIIKEKRDLKLYKKLPISICKTYAMQYEVKENELSEDEQVKLTSQLLSERLTDFLSDKEAKRLVTHGELSPEGYKMVCDATVSSAVGKIQEFEVE